MEARLQESAAELALRQGEAPESVKKFGKGGQRKSRKKVDSHRMAEGGDSDRMAEDDDATAYVEALANKKALYVVEGEHIHVERLDRRSGGPVNKTKRQALKDEAMTAVGLWQDRQILGSAVPRVAPEQRSSIDDFLDSLIHPRDLHLDCNPKLEAVQFRVKHKDPRKYVYLGASGQALAPEDAPRVLVSEDWIKDEEPHREYIKKKDYEALKKLKSQLRRRILCGEIFPKEGKNYWRAKIVGPRLYRQKAVEYEVLGERYRVKEGSPEEQIEEVLQKVMAKQKQRAFDSSASLPKMLYREERPEDEEKPEPQMERDFLQDARGEQQADFFEYLNSFQWFHCRDGCRRRFFYTRMPVPSRRVPCCAGESTDVHLYRAPPGGYDGAMSALSHCVTPALDHPPCNEACHSSVCKQLEGWRLWDWKYSRVMSLAQERIFRAREAEWTTDEAWQSKVHVREQLTTEDCIEAHRLEGTPPFSYATTTIHCERCADFESRLQKMMRTRPTEISPTRINPYGRDNKMWKGRVVDVLADMRGLTEMAISKVHVVMQVWALRTSGQTVFFWSRLQSRSEASEVVRRFAEAS